MLQFNPNTRLTAKQLINNKMFDSFRNPSIEEPAPKKLVIDIDELQSFDYDKFKEYQTREEMVAMLGIEISLLQQ